MLVRRELVKGAQVHGYCARVVRIIDLGLILRAAAVCLVVMGTLPMPEQISLGGGT